MAASNSELKEEIAVLREEVLEYVPGKASRCPERVAFPDNLYIGLFGRTGCGKTSLINSLKFAVHGRLRRCQAATREKDENTVFRIFADITKRISVIDNRCLDNLNAKKLIAEIVAQLDGKRGYGSKVIWQGENDENDLDTSGLDVEHLDKSGHPIACAVLVLSAFHDIESNAADIEEVIRFLHDHQGRYPVTVITHVDVARKSYVQALKGMIAMCGVSDIFEVANLTVGKKKLEEFYQLSLLNFLGRCMTDGDETSIFNHRKENGSKQKRRATKLDRHKGRSTNQNVSNMAACDLEVLPERIAELRQLLFEYQGKASFPDYRVASPVQFNIGLFGPTGCGKTSLINSLKFAAHGKLRRSQWLQVSLPEMTAGVHTMFRKLADITKRIFVIDNRGLNNPNTKETMAELAAQLDGRRGYCEIVRWDYYSDLDDKLDQFSSTIEQRIDCAVLVFSAQQGICYDTSGLANLISFLHSHQGHYPLAMITHVDDVAPSQVEDLKTVLRSSGISDIFEVANITHSKNMLEELYQYNLLLFLKNCLIQADKNSKYKQLTEEQNAQERKLQKERERVSSLEKKLQEKDENFTALEKEMHEVLRQMASQKEEMQKREEQVADLKKDVHEKEVQITALKKHMQEVTKPSASGDGIQNQLSQHSPVEGASNAENRGNSSSYKMTEASLHAIADKLGNHDAVLSLARNLGFEYAQWQSYKVNNKDGTFEGTRSMLMEWKRKTEPSVQSTELKEALVKSEFIELAESMFAKDTI